MARLVGREKSNLRWPPGFRQAAKIFFDPFEPMRHLLRHNQGTGEDLISEGPLEIWRRGDKFEGRSAISTWMISIAHFEALPALRRRGEEELYKEVTDVMEDRAGDPEVALAK